MNYSVERGGFFMFVKIWLVLGLAIFCLSPEPVVARIELTTLPERTEVELNFSGAGEALVRERRLIFLQAGENLLEFSRGEANIDPASIELMIPPETDVSLLESRQPPGEQVILWNLESRRDRELKVGIVYRLGGLSRHLTYRAFLNPESERLELQQHTTVFNNSGENFTGINLRRGEMELGPQNLPDGEAKQFTTFSQENIPFTVTYLFNSPDHRGADYRSNNTTGLPVIYSFLNNGSNNRRATSLPAGKVRLFEKSGGRELFLAETTIETTPAGDTVELAAGYSRELEVERRTVRQTRKNVRRDEDGRIQMYDREQQVVFELKNFRDQPVMLQLFERIPGEWEMLSSPEPFTKLEHELIKYQLNIPADSEKQLEIEYIQRHRGKRIQ